MYMYVQMYVRMWVYYIHVSIQELGHNSESQVLRKFSVLEEQLSGIERYVMRFLEAENSEIAALQLRQAEVRKIKYMIEQ